MNSKVIPVPEGQLGKYRKARGQKTNPRLITQSNKYAIKNQFVIFLNDQNLSCEFLIPVSPLLKLYTELSIHLSLSSLFSKDSM